MSTARRVLALLDRPPPAGNARWTRPLLAAALGDVSDGEVWCILRRNRIAPRRRKSWRESNDPDFVARPTELLALLKPYSPDAMRAYPVSTVVKSPKNDTPECIAPAA